MTWKSWGEEHKQMKKTLHHRHPSKKERHKLIPPERTYNYNFKSSNEKKRQCITNIQAGTKTTLDDFDSSVSQTYKHAQLQSIPERTYKDSKCLRHIILSMPRRTLHHRHTSMHKFNQYQRWLINTFKLLMPWTIAVAYLIWWHPSTAWRTSNQTHIK